jgi:predicted permease
LILYQQQLNRLNVSLFTPSLLFSKVAFFLTPRTSFTSPGSCTGSHNDITEKLRELWVIPIFFVIVTVLSMAVAFLLGWTFRLKRSQRSFAVAASMFMNSNSLPIALMQSLVVTVPALRWEADDDKNSMLARALTYLVLYSTLGMVVRWSYGVRLLSQADPDGVENSPIVDEPMQPEDGVEGLLSHNLDSSDNEHIPNIKVLSPPRPLGMAPRRNPTNVFYSFPNTPALSVIQLPDSISDSQIPYGTDEEDDDDELPRARPVTEPTRSRLHSILRRIRRRIATSVKALNEFMTVPLWAALASLIVACVAPLQEFLKNEVQPVKGALNNAGHCSIPLTLVVLGAYFYTPPSEGDKVDPRRRESTHSDSTLSFTGSIRSILKLTNTSRGKRRSRHNNSRPGETKTVIIAIVSRMIITPALLMPLIILCAKYDWHEVFEEYVSRSLSCSFLRSR